MIQVIAKEFNAFLNSLIAYVVIGVFLSGMGLLMWVFPETSVLEYGYADMDTLFSLGPYIFIFLIPAITMRSFAEEKKSGTMELLLTKPLTDWDIILGKFFACFLLVLFALIPTFIYYFSISALGNPVGNMDTPGVVGSYIGAKWVEPVERRLDAVRSVRAPGRRARVLECDARDGGDARPRRIERPREPTRRERPCREGMLADAMHYFPRNNVPGGGGTTRWGK